MRRELEQVEIPGEHDARERTWAVVRAAFEVRHPVERPRQHVRPILVLAAALAVLVAALSPPGQAVLDEIREVVGVEHAQPALFSLPASGQLLVSSDAGVWVVQPNGSKRLLGDYREASWSPFGRYVVAVRENELAALEPNGDVRWTLARRGARSPRWTGTETDTRIAYVDRTGLRVVAGDGTGNRLLVAGFRGRMAWSPGDTFLIALATSREVRVIDAISERTLWRRARSGSPMDVVWSGDGRRLLVASKRSVVVYGRRGAVAYELGSGTAPLQAATLSPSGTSLVFAAVVGDGSQIWVVPRVRPDGSAARRLFTGSGSFEDVTWTPDGRWVLVTWPQAEQWVFLRANGAGIRAVANVSEQFRSRSFPRVEGWCCQP